jgi:hypothetical protein
MGIKGLVMSNLRQSDPWPVTLPATAVALLFVIALSAPCVAQNAITLRFVDYRSGKPIPGVQVLATVWNGESLANFSSKAEVRITTRRDGTIRVPLPVTPPDHLNLASFDTFDTLSVDLPMDRILKSGATVVVDAHHSLDPQLKPVDEPGQVVIVTRKLTAGDRVASSFPDREAPMTEPKETE